MRKNLLLKIIVLLFAINVSIHNPAMAAGNAKEDLTNATQPIQSAIDFAASSDLAKARAAYDQYNKLWLEIEGGVKAHSTTAYRDIESNMGQVVYAFTLKKPEQVEQALKELQATADKFSSGGYPKETAVNENQMSIDDFILLLQSTKTAAKDKQQAEALKNIKKANDSWLSVEGSVVAQSSTVYSDSERDLVNIQAMLSASPPNYDQAIATLTNMVSYLTPLASKTDYTYWDAAMILIREGLEALLVVIALLSFVKKSGAVKGKKWIWTGVLSGLGVSVILALIVKFVLSSGAFGNNNALIGGWTGIFAAVMLVYMSYWLHSQSSIADWNRYLREKSHVAITTGKLMSLGLLAFLAVFREGTETVLFYIGMASQIKVQTLLFGFLIGAAILGIVAFLMVYLGLKLPLRPFFMVSSVIVFYLAVKFTGMGIHSLQLAGLIPTTSAPSGLSMEFLALYPSWESIIPQLALIVAVTIFLLIKKLTNKHVITN